MYSSCRHSFHLLERHLGRFKPRFQLQGMSKMRRGLLIMSICLEDLPQSKVLLPGTFVWWLHLQRTPGKEDGIVQILEGEKNTSQIEKNLRVVRRDGQGPPEALYRFGGIAFYAPEVADLVVKLHGLWFLLNREKWGSQLKLRSH